MRLWDKILQKMLDKKPVNVYTKQVPCGFAMDD